MKYDSPIVSNWIFTPESNLQLQNDSAISYMPDNRSQAAGATFDFFGWFQHNDSKSC